MKFKVGDVVQPLAANVLDAVEEGETIPAYGLVTAAPFEFRCGDFVGILVPVTWYDEHGDVMKHNPFEFDCAHGDDDPPYQQNFFDNFLELSPLSLLENLHDV